MLSSSFSRVLGSSREHYLYVYSVYVLEASTSNRLTHFYPPFNLLALVIFRPLRLFFPSNNKFRSARIVLLKATHLPIVAAIEFYEWISGASGKSTQYNGFRGPRQSAVMPSPMPTQKKWSQSPGNVRPQASTSSLRPSEYTRPAPPRLTRRQATQAEEAAEGLAYGEAANDVEVRIADLSIKIDRLTELIVNMQAAQSKSIAEVAVA
jgi:hypothetical protein